jgi:hypothetical protein
MCFLCLCGQVLGVGCCLICSVRSVVLGCLVACILVVLWFGIFYMFEDCVMHVVRFLFWVGCLGCGLCGNLV